MRLSRFGPKTRTVLITAIVLMLALAISATAMGKEIRVYPASSGAPAGEADLIACVTGLAPIFFGPDGGQVSAPGDTCVLNPGTYFPAIAVAPWLAGDVPILLPNLTVRSSNGRDSTVVVGQFIVVAIANGVTIGGPAKDQGLSIIAIPGTIAAAPVGSPVGPAGVRVFATENFTVQNCYIGASLGIPSVGDGIAVRAAASIENFNFIDNIISLNNVPAAFAGAVGNGIAFYNLGSVGRRGPEENIIIEGNKFDNNLLNHILFANVGAIEQAAILSNELINSIVLTGIAIVAPVTDIRDMVVSYNTVRNNFLFGMLFANLARIENLIISDNRGDTPSQGVTANGLAGIVFASGGDIRDSMIDNNAINSNGTLGISIAGVLFLNLGDLENWQFTGNEVRQNTAAVSIFSGVFRLGFPGSEFSRSLVADNAIRNNGGLLGGVGGFIDVEFGRIDGIEFANNDVRENGGALILSAGVGLMSLFSDVSAISFSGDQFHKNGVINLAMFSLLNDVSEITMADVTSNEAQGLSIAGFPLFFPGNGDGALILTTVGDVDNVTVTNSTFNNNGGAGMTIQALVPTVLVPVLGAPGDVDNVTVTNSNFNYNGTRAPIGRGSGLYIGGQTVRNVVIDPTVADYNNDHGVEIASGRDLMDVTITDSEFSNNDRNVDTVGNGISLSANENLDTVEIRGSKASSNNTGIRISIQDRIGREITIADNPEINDNRDSGILISAARDLADVGISGNSLSGNLTGLQLLVNERGSDIEVSGNKIVGADGQGTGILLDSGDVYIHENSVRKAGTGILVRKERDNAIHQNNIARNEDFGVDATALNPGQTIDATDNWWGEPSGPKHATNPNGIGDRVTDKVLFDPWLGEPAVATDVFFEVQSFTGPTEADKGEPVQYVAEIENTGTEEGSQEITLSVTKMADGTVVSTKSVTKTINPAAATTVTFDYEFTQGGDYQVCVETQNDQECLDVSVAGPVMLTIEQAVAQHSGSATLIEDPDIIWAVELWIEDDIVPGTDGLKIDDAKILQLVGMWIDETPVAAAAAAVEQKKSSSFFDWLLGFFASRSAVAIEHQASPTRVAPGSSFTVTVQVDGEGLLLAESLPSGWTITPVENGGAFYKPSEGKWLWLGGSGSLAYEVAVPADAAPGTYTISGSYQTSDGAGSIAPITIEVAGAPVALEVDAIKFAAGSFVVQGVGVAAVEAQVWNLAGSLVFSGSAQGSALALAAEAPLANGVYLYTVTVKGHDGAVVQSDVRKLVLLR